MQSFLPVNFKYDMLSLIFDSIIVIATIHFVYIFHYGNKHVMQNFVMHYLTSKNLKKEYEVSLYNESVVDVFIRYIAYLLARLVQLSPKILQTIIYQRFYYSYQILQVYALDHFLIFYKLNKAQILLHQLLQYRNPFYSMECYF